MVKRYSIFVIALLLSLLVVKREPFSIGLALNRDKIKQAEFFPFSSFPMYSGFSARPFVVYIADSDGKPLASLHEFGVRTSVLKKDYERRLKKIKAETGVSLQNLSTEQKRPAGEATLAHLTETLASQEHPKALQLWEIIITRENGSIVKRPMKIAELN